MNVWLFVMALVWALQIGALFPFPGTLEAAASLAVSNQGGEIWTRSFVGPVTGKRIVYNVYLPPEYQSGEQRYPVIYHLHGAGGDQSSSNDVIVGGLQLAVSRKGFQPSIIVFPNGFGNSMWADSKDGTMPAETSLIRELMPHVEASYRTLRSREFRILQGSSMGGYGAAMIASKYPEAFAACLIIDGAMHDWNSLSTKRETITREVFDNNRGYYERFSPWVLASRNAARIKGKVAFRIVVGALLDMNQRYRQHLEDLGLDVEYVETGCEHSAGCITAKVGLDNFDFFVRKTGLSYRVY